MLTLTQNMFDNSIIFKLYIKIQTHVYCRIITAIASFVNISICDELSFAIVLTIVRIDAVGGDLQHVGLCVCV